MPTLKKAVIRKRKKELKTLKESEGLSFSALSRIHLKGRVKRGVLQRFISEADYVPKDPRIVQALGLIVPDNPYRQIPTYYKRIPKTLEYFRRTNNAIKEMSGETRKKLPKRRI